MELVEVAWKTTAPSYDFMRNQSLTHLHESARGFTLCGLRVPWERVNNGDTRHCTRCRAIAANKGLELP